MLIAAHSIAGAALGEAVDNPVLAFLLAVVLHFVLDSIPHYDTTDRGKFTWRQILLVAVDAAIGLTILYAVYGRYAAHKSSFIMGAIGGIAPDIFSSVPFIQKIIVRTKIGKSFDSFHRIIQSVSLPLIPGILVQILVIALALYLSMHHIV